MDIKAPIPAIQVIDNFCPQIDIVRQSALDSGFGTWKPNKGRVGSSNYEGMNWKGDHAVMIHSIAFNIGRPIYPQSMFFRITQPTFEKAYIHSDRADGDFTCVCYLSEHHERCGTAFYRHRKTGLLEMPTFEEQEKLGVAKLLKKDMVNGGKAWDQLDFVHARYNRAVIFRAPLFHSRIPLHGIGKTAECSRMVWVCHFHVE